MGVCNHIGSMTCPNCLDQYEPRVWYNPPLKVQPIGWECPKCGTVNNPNLPSCFGCKPSVKP